MIVETVKKSTAVGYRSETGSRRPVSGEVGGKAVIVTASGRVFVGGEEVSHGLSALQESMGLHDLIGDDESEEQWGWTKRLTGEVMKMILGSDRKAVADLASGKIQIEAVVDRAMELVKKMVAVQIGYEEGRGRVAHLDVDQAASRAIERVLSDSSHNWFNWRGVPEEMKGVVIKLLENYQQSQAVAAAAGLSSAQMVQGLANLKSMAQARLDVEAGYQERMIGVANTKREGKRTDLKERNRIKTEARQAVVEIMANAALRSGKGVADVLRYHGTQLTAFVMNKDDGLVPMTGEGLQAFLDKIKEPKVWCGAGGVTASIVGTTMVITAVGMASGPLAMVTVPLVLISAGIAGGGLGAKVPEWVGRKFGGGTNVDSE